MKKLPIHFQKLERDHLLTINTIFGINITKEKFKNILKGGFIDNKIYEFIDTGGLYTYNVRITDENYMSGTYIEILTKDEKECVTIIIEDELAIIHGLTYMNECAKEGLQHPGGGTKLLRFSLNLILQNQYRFNIKRILVSDHSFMDCDGSKSIKLAQLRLITHGEPWYSSFGFKPFDSYKQDLSIVLYNALNESNERLDKLKAAELDISKIVDISNESNKIKYNKKEILSIAKKYPKIRDFVKKLSQNFNIYCYFLIHYLDELYRPGSQYGIVDYYMKSFYLDI